MASTSGKDMEEEAKVSDDDRTAQDWWSKLYRSLIGLFCSSAASSTPKCRAPATSWYHSARIQDMMERRGEFSSEVEAAIAASEVTWSELDRSVTSQPAEHSGMTNRECFEVLKRRKYFRKGDEIGFEQVPEDEYATAPHYGSFFVFWSGDVVVGEKLAEGGQAEIYAATYSNSDGPFVAKVFKGGSVLRHLEKQIPPALLHYHSLETLFDPDSRVLPNHMKATLLTDERLGWEDRFAFVMSRYWGDLRTLIDHRMMHSSHNRGPPFPEPMQLVWLMFQIAYDMNVLHSQCPPILHNDLKAANVLVLLDRETNEPDLNEDGGYWVIVADYECSVGVEGTGLWRAPEILQQLEHRVAGSALVFTEKCDVYSYGMVCYELVTGRIPFEGCSPYEGRDVVLKGGRPELPPDIDPLVKEIIVGCWQADPSNRPSFESIEKKLRKRLN